MRRKMTQQSADIVTITPEHALDILENAKNMNFRSLRSGYAAQLAAQMSAGAWHLNGEAIKFDESGILVDGQHRLKACVLSGVPLRTWLVRGVPRDAEMDMGHARLTHDRLTAQGEVDSRSLGAALAALMMIETGKREFRGGSQSYQQQILGCLARHPRIREFVSLRKPFGIFDRPSVFPALYYCFDAADRLKAKHFMGQLSDGVNVQVGAPVLVLRNMLLKMRVSRRKMDVLTTLAVTIKAWNHELAGREVRYIAWKAIEDFPQIEGCTLFGKR